MPGPRQPIRYLRGRFVAPCLAAVVVLAAGCSAAGADTAVTTPAESADATAVASVETTEPAPPSSPDTSNGAQTTEAAQANQPAQTDEAAETSDRAEPSGTAQTDDASAVFDPDVVHEIVIDVDTAALQAVVDAYVDTGGKEWLSATVTIDGSTYEEVGLRLKGNSSLRGIDSTTAPATLPWLIRFDKYVSNQAHVGYADLVIRSNSTSTALNEAVALDLLEVAGLGSQRAAYTSLAFNGGDAQLRLIIEHPDDVWMADNFSADGALYKAESTGDYRYRGDDPEDYDDVFDQEAGKDNTDLVPLIDLLDFVNTSDDATFAAELDDHLDVEAFARYLAMMELLDNFDDIDGPGNNSYLYYDAATERFTVVAWDLNLAFGARPGGGAAGPGGPGNSGGPGAPGGAAGGPARTGPGGDNGVGAPNGAEGRGGPNGRGGANPLVERFLAVPEFDALYRDATAELEAQLFDGGLADQLVDARVETLQLASERGLIDSAEIAADAATLAAAIS